MTNDEIKKLAIEFGADILSCYPQDTPYMCNNGGWTVAQLQNAAAMQSSQMWGKRYAQDVNACTESVYPVKNNNSMNKKLESAKKWLKENKS